LIKAFQVKLFDVVKEFQPISRDDLIFKIGMGKRSGEAIINVITALGNISYLILFSHLLIEEEFLCLLQLLKVIFWLVMENIH
jgi:hypothetical protein